MPKFLCATIHSRPPPEPGSIHAAAPASAEGTLVAITSGKSRGGWTTKIHMVAADARTAITFSLSPGQAHDAPEGRKLLNRLGQQHDNPSLLMDRAYEGNETRQSWNSLDCFEGHRRLYARPPARQHLGRRRYPLAGLAVVASAPGKPLLHRIAQTLVIDARPTVDRAQERQALVGGRLTARWTGRFQTCPCPDPSLMCDQNDSAR